MCQYCENEKRLFRLNSGSNIGAIIKKCWRGWYIVIDTAITWHHALKSKWIIKYCPMCGKKLGDSEWEKQHLN